MVATRLGYACWRLLLLLLAPTRPPFSARWPMAVKYATWRFGLPARQSDITERPQGGR